MRLTGKGDQGAGLVWRYRDPNNYYVTRCNALENDCTIYHVVNGRRHAFLNQSVKVASNTWHTLKVEARGDHFLVTYDGKTVLDAKDGTLSSLGHVEGARQNTGRIARTTPGNFGGYSAAIRVKAIGEGLMPQMIVMESISGQPGQDELMRDVRTLF